MTCPVLTVEVVVAVVLVATAILQARLAVLQRQTHETLKAHGELLRAQRLGLEQPPL